MRAFVESDIGTIDGHSPKKKQSQRGSDIPIRLCRFREIAGPVFRHVEFEEQAAPRNRPHQRFDKVVEGNLKRAAL